MARALDAQGAALRLVITGQHPGLKPTDHGFDRWPLLLLDCPGQADPDEHATMLRHSLTPLLTRHPPELVMVQGDTSSAYGGALAAGEAGVALAHVEAGLRTHDPDQPWPEEGYRTAIDAMAELMFAPTSGNAANLAREQVMGEVHVTGNSGIDALDAEVRQLRLRPRGPWMRRFARGPLRLLVTCHRRENWGAGIERLAEALGRLAERRVAQVSVVLHPNPLVSATLYRLLGDQPGITLLAPLSHPAMLRALAGADLALSDSGGLQEEAPALGVPLLVLRDNTERPEGIASGSMLLTGTDPDRLVEIVTRLDSDRGELARMARPARPFGDGQSSPRIAALALGWIERQLTSPTPATIARGAGPAPPSPLNHGPFV